MKDPNRIDIKHSAISIMPKADAKQGIKIDSCHIIGGLIDLGPYSILEYNYLENVNVTGVSDYTKITGCSFRGGTVELAGRTTVLNCDFYDTKVLRDLMGLNIAGI